MGKRFVLRELEEKHGDLHKVIPALVNAHGQGGAACILGTTQATISRWLHENGYEKTESWQRQPEPA